MKVFETVKYCNLTDCVGDLRLNHFSAEDFQGLDAPRLMPSGSMKSGPTMTYWVAQGAFLREGEENVA